MYNYLFKNIRVYIVTVSLGVAIFLKIIFYSSFYTTDLTQVYAGLAVLLLYLALLISPLISAFPLLPWKGQLTKSRRALGVSAFLFAALHGYSAFFNQLQGFTGLGFLSGNYLLAVVLGTAALFILFLLAVTSFDKVIRLIGFKRWKFLHTFVYLAAVIIFIHALLLGSHFLNLPTSKIARASFLLVSVLGFLEALRLDKVLKKVFKIDNRFGISFVIMTGLFVGGIATFQLGNSVSIHGRGNGSIQKKDTVVDGKIIKQANLYLISLTPPTEKAQSKTVEVTKDGGVVSSTCKITMLNDEATINIKLISDSSNPERYYIAPSFSPLPSGIYRIFTECVTSENDSIQKNFVVKLPL